MATLTVPTARAGTPARTAGLSGQPVTVYGEYSLAAALALNDVIQMVRVPAGARVTDLSLAATDLDTGGSPAITLSVGDGGATARYISASTIGQAGGIANGISVATGFGYLYTAEDTIDVLVAAGPAIGATSGTVRLAVTYIPPA